MATLFARILLRDFVLLPPRVRALHARELDATYRGKADIERGRGALARLMSLATALPAAGRDVPLSVTIQPSPSGERWIRDFDGRLMPSRLFASHGLLGERLGLATFGFALSVEEGELIWRVRHVRALGLPLPAAWFRGVIAREFERDGQYRFDVRAELPLVGLLVHYRGYLDVD